MSVLAVGNRVIFRSTFAVSNTFSTSMLRQPPLLGYVIAATPDVSVDILWNNAKRTNGLRATATADPDSIPVLKAVTGGTPTTLRGKVVRSIVSNQNSGFVGMVEAFLGIQLIPDPATDVFTDHVIVRTPDGLFWIAPTSDVAVVPGR